MRHVAAQCRLDDLQDEFATAFQRRRGLRGGNHRRRLGRENRQVERGRHRSGDAVADSYNHVEPFERVGVKD